jgi:hypothetical protein
MLDFIGNALVKVVADSMALDRWLLGHIAASVDAVIAPAVQRTRQHGPRLLMPIQKHKH